LLAAATALYTTANLYRLAHFYPLDFDLSIFGQGVWLLAQGETPFVTIRGLNLFGDHASWVHLPIAFVYGMLGPAADVRLLVLVQSAALAWAGFALFRIARGELGLALALLVLVAYLLYPGVQHSWLEYYEPATLAVPLLLLAAQSVRERRDRPAFVYALLALSTVEYMAATVAALGLYAAAVGRRRLGLGLLAVSGLYVLFVMRVTFPWLSDHGYEHAYRLYGSDAGSTIDGIAYLARPDHLASRLATPENGRYLLSLLTPVAFLPLAAPAMLGAAAQLWLNLVSSWPYAHEIRYHYVAPVVPFVFLSLVRAFALWPPGSRRLRAAAVALLVGIVLGQALYGSPWVVPGRGHGLWRGRAEDVRERAEVRALLARIPDDASVSAHYRFLPALCARRRLFMFPDMGPPGTDVLLLDEPLLATSPGDAAAFAKARESAGYVEAARTTRGTVLFFRAGYAPFRDDADRPRFPPVGRPPACPSPGNTVCK